MIKRMKNKIYGTLENIKKEDGMIKRMKNKIYGALENIKKEDGMIKRMKNKIYGALEQIDLLGGRLFYKNLLGMKLNYSGLKRLKENQKNSSISLNAYLSREITSKGYHIFSVDKDKCSEIENSYSKIIADPEYAYIWDKDGKTASQDDAKFFMLKNTVKSIPNVLSLLTPSVMNIVYSYFGSYATLSYANAYRTVNLDIIKSKKEVFAYRLHQDKHIKDTLKLFVLLSDVSEDHGPFTFYNKRDSKKILSLGYKDRFNYGKAKQFIESGEKTLYLTGKRGTAAICDTASCFHRAGIPQKGTSRDLLILSFNSSSDPLLYDSPEVVKKISEKIDQDNMQY